jgi:hypothetical protein
VEKPTIEVTRISDGERVVINSDDFDANLHKRDAVPKRRLRRKDKVE